MHPFSHAFIPTTSLLPSTTRLSSIPSRNVVRSPRYTLVLSRNSPVQPKPPSHSPAPNSPPPLPFKDSNPNPPTPPPDQSIWLLAGLSITVLLAVQFLPQAPSVFPDSLEMPTDPDSLLSAITGFLNGPHFAVSVGMGLSGLIQALTGFGFSIVSVAALTQVPWIANSSVFNTVPVIAATLCALTGWLLLLPDITKVKWKDISTLLIASTLTTPLGVLMLEVIDPDVVIRFLGALITGYVMYSLLGIQVPKELGENRGAWTLGFLAGALGGAFDITGPPLVLHGEAKGWDGGNGEFRRNILAVVTVNSSLVVLWDLIVGKLDDFYYSDFLGVALPTTLAGVVLGKLLAGKLDASGFKTVVLGTCLIMGVKLLVG